MEVPYKDVYTLDLPFAPPPEVAQAYNHQQESQIARMLASQRVMHTLRLCNTSKFPFTTAPALVLSGGRVIAQGLMTHASPGADVDLEVTKAVDIRMKKSEKEIKRTPSAQQWDGYSYIKVDFEGTITLENLRGKSVDVEIRRHVLGNIDSADHGGVIQMVNVFEDDSFLGGAYQPFWWQWYSWPYWWRHFNGMGRIDWKITLKEGEKVELKYQWNYYWR
jgi:hypothetical protein